MLKGFVFLIIIFSLITGGCTTTPAGKQEHHGKDESDKPAAESRGASESFEGKEESSGRTANEGMEAGDKDSSGSREVSQTFSSEYGTGETDSFNSSAADRINRDKDIILSRLSGRNPVVGTAGYIVESVRSSGGLITSGGIGAFTGSSAGIPVECSVTMLDPADGISHPEGTFSLERGEAGGIIYGTLLAGLDGGYEGFNGIEVRDRIILIDLDGKSSGWARGAAFQAGDWGAGAVVFFNPERPTVISGDSGVLLFSTDPGKLPFRLRTADSSGPGEYFCRIDFPGESSESKSLPNLRIIGSFPGETTPSFRIHLPFSDSLEVHAENIALLLEAGRRSGMSENSPSIEFVIEFSSQVGLPPSLTKRAGSWLLPPDTVNPGCIEEYFPGFGYVRLPYEFSFITLNDNIFPRGNKQDLKTSVVNIIFELIGSFKDSMGSQTEWIETEGTGSTPLEEQSSRIIEKTGRLISLLENHALETASPENPKAPLTAEEIKQFQFLYSRTGIFPNLLRRRMLLNRAVEYLSRGMVSTALDDALYIIEGARLSVNFTPETVKKAGLLYPAVISELLLSLELKRDAFDDLSGEIRELEFWIEQYDIVMNRVLDVGFEILEQRF